MTCNQRGTLNTTSWINSFDFSGLCWDTGNKNVLPKVNQLHESWTGRSQHTFKKNKCLNVYRCRDVSTESYPYLCTLHPPLGTAATCRAHLQTVILLSNKSTYHRVAGSVWRANIISLIPGRWDAVLAAGWKWSCSTDCWWQPAISLRWSEARALPGDLPSEFTTIRLLCMLWTIEEMLSVTLERKTLGNICTHPCFLPSFLFCRRHNETLSLSPSQAAKAGILSSTNLWNDSADTSASLSPLLTCICGGRKRVLLRQETGQKHSWRADQITSALRRLDRIRQASEGRGAGGRQSES